MPADRRLALSCLVAAALGGCQADVGQVVNVYSHRHYDTDQMLFDRFTELTGIEVRVVTASADDLITRLATEGEASPADVLITVDAGRLHRAKEQGLLRTTRSVELEATVPPHLRDSEGYWYGLTERARVLAYSLERVNVSELSTYEALADPIWRGRILTRSSENIYNISLVASLIAANGAAATETWAEGVVANFARTPQGADRDQILDVAAGVGDVAIVNTYYVGQLLNDPDPAIRQLASQVGVFFPNQGDRGTHINVSGAGVTAHAPNPENAIRLIEFLVSEEAQRSFAQTVYEYPVRAGVALAPTLEAWGGFRADELSLDRLGELGSEAVAILDRAGWR
jgi:iron(III) transport system substrate-binding protein